MMVSQWVIARVVKYRLDVMMIPVNESVRSAAPPKPATAPPLDDDDDDSDSSSNSSSLTTSSSFHYSKPVQITSRSTHLPSYQTAIKSDYPEFWQEERSLIQSNTLNHTLIRNHSGKNDFWLSWFVSLLEISKKWWHWVNLWEVAKKWLRNGQ